jgi:hypothetical protein
MSETKREYAAHYPQAAAAHPLQEGPVRQPARSAQEEPAGASGRRAGLRHDKRTAAKQRNPPVPNCERKTEAEPPPEPHPVRPVGPTGELRADAPPERKAHNVSS